MWQWQFECKDGWMPDSLAKLSCDKKMNKCLVYESGLNYEFIPIVWLYVKIARELWQDMQCSKLRGLGSI